MFTTLLYVVLALGDPEGTAGRRSRGWLPPGLVRRVVDAFAGASLMVAAMGASAGVSSAAPMPVPATARPLATPVNGSSAAVAVVGHGSSAVVSGGQRSASVVERGEVEVTPGPAPAGGTTAVNDRVVGRHLPHPGVLLHTVPPPMGVGDPRAPSVDNGLAGLPAGTKVVVVQPGDCLSMLAQNHLGDWRADAKSFQLNVGRAQPTAGPLADENWIYPGQVLIMPAEATGTVVVGAAPAAVRAPSSSAPTAPSSPSVSLAPGPAASRGAAVVAPAAVSSAAAVGGSAAETATVSPAPAQPLGAATTWQGQYTFTGNGVAAQRVQLGSVDGPLATAPYSVQEIRSVLVAPPTS